MNRKIKLTVSPADRTIIVAALRAYDVSESGMFAEALVNNLALRVAAQDPADDGPEIAILKTFVLDKPDGWDA